MKYLLSIILCLWVSCAWAFPPGFIGAITQRDVVAGGLTSIFNDTFTAGSDVTLASHTSDSGGSWVKNNNVCPTDMSVNSSQGVLIGNSSTACTLYVADVAPASPSYTVYGDIYVSSAVGAEMITARTSKTVATFYYAGLDRTNSLWKINKKVSGATTILNSIAYGGGTGAKSLRLEVSGTSSTVLNLYVNDVLTLTATDTSGDITGAGFAGVFTTESQLSTGSKMTSFEVKQ